MFCMDCWGGYLASKIGDGPKCIMATCMEQGCKAVVPAELFQELVQDAAQREKYEKYTLQQFVEANRAVQYCPSPGCLYVVEYAKGEARDIVCACGHAFCWKCQQEAHQPVKCVDVARWIKQNEEDALFNKWAAVNTKPCPKCSAPCQKDSGCAYVTCRCGYEFCWLCLQHMPGHHHASGQCGVDGGNDFGTSTLQYQSTSDEEANKAANKDLERAGFYQERFDLHEQGRVRAQTDWRLAMALKQDVLRVGLGFSPQDIRFMQDGLTQLADARRCLKWTFAYAFFGERDLAAEQLKFLQFLQGKLQDETELLYALLDPNDQSQLHSSSFLSRGQMEVMSYKKKLMQQVAKVKGLMQDMINYFEGGMVNPKATIGGVRGGMNRNETGTQGEPAVPRGHWKCPQCPMINSIRKRKCPSCNAWKPR